MHILRSRCGRGVRMWENGLAGWMVVWKKYIAKASVAKTGNSERTSSCKSQRQRLVECVTRYL